MQLVFMPENPKNVKQRTMPKGPLDEVAEQPYTILARERSHAFSIQESELVQNVCSRLHRHRGCHLGAS